MQKITASEPAFVGIQFFFILQINLFLLCYDYKKYKKVYKVNKLKKKFEKNKENDFVHNKMLI